MEWLKLGSVVFLGAMLAFIYPRMRHAIKHSPKGTMKDWMGYIIPIAGVILFIIFLIAMVRG